MPAVKPFSWSFDTLKNLFVKAYKDWSADEAPRMGAALAYYTLLSLAPLLLIAIAIAGFVFGREAAQGQLLDQIGQLVGPQGAEAIQSMVLRAGSQKSSGVVASVIGVFTLLLAAASVVGELRTDLNKIFKVPANQAGGIAGEIKQRSYALALVIGTGFLLMVSLIISTVISAAGTYFSDVLPVPEFVLHIMNLLISLAVTTGIFAVMFKVLPDLSIAWKDVWLGAAFTAILFSIGKVLIGLYLGKASVGSTFGAAGSLVIVLVWVYYSAQIFFFGAEFTQAYAREYGSLAQVSDAMRKQQRDQPAPQPQTALDSYTSAAASGSAALPPIVPTDLRTKPNPPTFAGNLGAIIGLTVVTGKRVIRVIKSGY
jgi:membrane protein